MMTLREEVMKDAGVLNEGLFDKLKLKKMKAQMAKLLQQAQAEQDPQKKQELVSQTQELRKQIQKLEFGPIDDKMKPYMDQARGQQVQAAKKHEGCCPQCGKKFSACTCK